MFYTQISTMGVADYFKRQLKTVRFSIWRAVIETTSKWLYAHLLQLTYKSNST